MRPGTLGYMAGAAADDRAATEAPGSALTAALLRTPPVLHRASLPTRGESDRWQYAMEVLMYCNVPQTDERFVVAPATSFLELIGGDTSTSIQELADVTWQEIEAALDTWLIGDINPGNIMKGREIVKGLLDDGTFVAPGTTTDKDSFV